MVAFSFNPSEQERGMDNSSGEFSQMTFSEDLFESLLIVGNFVWFGENELKVVEMKMSRSSLGQTKMIRIKDDSIRMASYIWR